MATGLLARPRRQDLVASGLRVRLLVSGFAALLLLASCGELASPTVPGGLPSPGPTAGTSPAATPTPARTPQPTPPPWPSDWETDFCAVFAEVVIAQELVVDIPRAIDEDAVDDALALARELRQTTSTAEELLGNVPDWEPGQPAISAMESLADIGNRIGRQWIRFLDEGRRAGRTRARELNEEMQPVVVEANEALDELAGQGLECPPLALSLESP